MITGGQSVEYGNALSGVVNQITKEGGARHGGNLSIRTNDMGGKRVFVGERDQMKDVQASLSGPVPLFSKLDQGNMYYFLSGQLYDTKGRFEHDDSTLSSVFGKLTYKISPRHKLTFSGAYSDADYTFFSNLWSRPTNEDRLNQFKPEYAPDGSLSEDYNFLDENGNPWYGNGKIDTEDLNHDGVVSPEEDLDADGVIDTEDLNHNGGVDIFNMQEHLPYFDHNTNSFNLKWNHTIDARTFYEISLSRYETRMHYNTREYYNEDANGNGMFDMELKYSSIEEIPDDVWSRTYVTPDGESIPYRDLLQVQGDGDYYYFDFNRNGVFENEDLNGNNIWDWKVYGPEHDLFTDNNDNGYIDASEHGPSDNWLRWEDINFNSNSKDNDDFYLYGDGKTYNRARWNKDYKIIYTLKGNLTSQVHRFHQIKAGAEAQFMEIFDHDVDMASGGNVYGQNFKAKPRLYGAWLEDKMEFEGMVINAGVRADLFDINWNDYPADITDPVTDPSQGGEVKNPVNIDPKIYWGPRMGVAFPITEYDLLSFNYSKNFQSPVLRFAFTNVNWDFSGAFPLVGNPNLDPEQTTAYELTLRHQFTSDLAVVATGFYKDISGLVDTRQVFYTPRNWYGLYINLDYGNVRGFELNLEKRFGDFYSGSINYTYSVAKGKASSSRQNYENAWAENVIKTTENYLDWDQRHTVNAFLQFRTPQGSKPFGYRFLEDWMVSVIGKYGSGLPFSSPARDKDPPVNDMRLPYTLTFDARVQKRYAFSEHMAALFYIQGYNIFNHHNIDQRFFQANADTGWYTQNDSDNDGNPDYDVDGKHNDPRYWQRSRYFQMGFGLEF